MDNTQIMRTLQWLLIIFLIFCGPIGWILIYLLWKQWNPKLPFSKARASKAKKSAKATRPAKTTAKKKPTTKK